ncbi:MAG: hypothetical protein MUC35_01570 [Candidatus Margulisbacteria bacterium]|jgi:hypothetical protein|nr:hypothetical protein [Candidatus Margulisiibacteriota bacterium]
MALVRPIENKPRWRQLFKTVLGNVITWKNLLRQRPVNHLEQKIINRLETVEHALVEGKRPTREQLERLEEELVTYEQKRSLSRAEKQLLAEIKAELTELKEVQAPVVPLTPTANQATVVNHPFTGDRPSVEVKPAAGFETRPFRLDSLIRFDHLIGRQINLETLLRALNIRVEFRGSDRIAELVSRLILRTMVDRLVREMARVSERGGELTEREIESLIRTLNQQSAERLTAEPAKPAPIESELTYDRTEKAIRLEIKGAADQTEAKAVLRELAKPDLPSFLAAAVPLLAELPDTVATISQVVASLPINEPVLVKSVTQLLTKGAAPAARAVASALAQQLPPAVALPLLLQTHAQALTAGNQPVARAAEQTLIEYARTTVGQQAVVTAFVEVKSRPLTTSAIGQKALLAAVTAVPTEVRATAPGTAQSTVEKVLNHVREIVKANPAQLAPAALTAEKAIALIELAVRLERSPAVIARQEKAAPPRRRVSSLPQPKVGIVNSLARRAVNRNPVIQNRVAVAQRELKGVMRAAEAANLVLPKSVIEHLCSGLAGINLAPLLNQPSVGGQFQSPTESRSASSLRHVVRALEAQAARAISSKDPIALTRVFTLSAQVMLYGIIMRLVGGKLSRVDQVIELLRQKKELARIVAKIRQGDIHDATEELYDAVHATTAYSELLAA